MRWGLVGTGPWARTVHAPSLEAHPDAEFTAVWGRDAAKAGELAGSHGAAVAESFDALLERVDAVSLAVAPSAQAEFAARAMDRGIHVLLEKPVSTDAAVVEDLAGRLRPGIRAVVFLTRLFEPVRAQWLRESIGRGYTHAHVEWISSALSPGSLYADSAWRRGSGMVWDLMPHVLSQVTPVLGEVVSASARPWPERDGMLFALLHASGATTDVRMTLTAAPEDKTEWIRFSGPAGESLTPGMPLDFVAAHSAAVAAVERSTDLRGDVLLGVATLQAAIAPTTIMATLAAEAAASDVADKGE